MNKQVSYNRAWAVHIFPSTSCFPRFIVRAARIEYQSFLIRVIHLKMTIYQENVTWNNNIYQHKYEDTSRRMTGFFKLFSVWKGSVIRLIYHNLLIFILIYYTLKLLYRYVFLQNPYQRELFELICVYFGRNMDKIPLTFLIGFYVQQVQFLKLFKILSIMPVR